MGRCSGSWLKGHGLVSLPFTDHCEPLLRLSGRREFPDSLVANCHGTSGMEVSGGSSDQLEFQPNRWRIGFLPAATYLLHTLDLRPDLNEMFRSLNKDSVQRRIQRAQRARLVEKCGRSDELLREFYALFVITRSRHRVPPTPTTAHRDMIWRLCYWF